MVWIITTRIQKEFYVCEHISFINMHRKVYCLTWYTCFDGPFTDLNLGLLGSWAWHRLNTSQFQGLGEINLQWLACAFGEPQRSDATSEPNVGGQAKLIETSWKDRTRGFFFLPYKFWRSRPETLCTLDKHSTIGLTPTPSTHTGPQLSVTPHPGDLRPSFTGTRHVHGAQTQMQAKHPCT